MYLLSADFNFSNHLIRYMYIPEVMDLCQEEQAPGAAEGRYEATIWTPSCCLQGFVSSAGKLIEIFCPKTQTAGSLFLFPLFLIPGR